jgi:hypothetical protein
VNSLIESNKQTKQTNKHIGKAVIKHTDRLQFGNARQKCATGLCTLIEILWRNSGMRRIPAIQFP